MRVRIVYESMFGNTAAIAKAVAAELSAYGEVEVLDVAAAAQRPEPAVDLLVVGAPTHALGMSRARTRRDAAARTEAPVSVDIGMREWLDAALPVPPGSRAAAFATKAAKPSWLPGSAARGAGKRLRRLGYELIDAPTDFLVDGILGPLTAGELERARAWADHLAQTERDYLAHRS
ncbi:flavodoxin domain-containing protein [Nocardia sp. NPDC049707]|uniref:flavodoxin domain-containing protein n=1 Tax=Nocardia sp. NPDC049707 TaxID=3154735 RepID=UPI00341DE9F5